MTGEVASINQYTLGRELGRGAFGVVRLAVEHKGTDRAFEVAVKVRAPSACVSQTALSNCVCEPHTCECLALCYWLGLATLTRSRLFCLSPTVKILDKQMLKRKRVGRFGNALQVGAKQDSHLRRAWMVLSPHVARVAHSLSKQLTRNFIVRCSGRASRARWRSGRSWTTCTACSSSRSSTTPREGTST